MVGFMVYNPDPAQVETIEFSNLTVRALQPGTASNADSSEQIDESGGSFGWISKPITDLAKTTLP